MKFIKSIGLSLSLIFVFSGCGSNDFSVTTGSTIADPIIFSISTVAGTGVAGYSGDSGSATASTLNWPEGVTVDSTGNIFITEQTNHTIRMISKDTGNFFGIAMTAGNIYTLAGTGVFGYTGDGGFSTAATLRMPSAVTTDAIGNVIVVDYQNFVIRMIAKTSATYFGVVMTAGKIYTIAGTGASGYTGDGGAALAATFSSPWGIGLDSLGNIFITDVGDHTIRMIAKVAGTYFGVVMTANNIYTIAGTGASGYTGDGAIASGATFNFPISVTVDPDDNLYIGDYGNHAIRMIAKVNGSYFGIPMNADKIYTVAGSGVSGYSGDGAVATASTMNFPVGVAVDSSGNLYVAEEGNNVVRMIPQIDGVYSSISMLRGNIYTIAGTGVASYTGDGGLAALATLNGPNGLAIDSTGNLYVAEYLNHVVRKISNH